MITLPASNALQNMKSGAKILYDWSTLPGVPHLEWVSFRPVLSEAAPMTPVMITRMKTAQSVKGRHHQKHLDWYTIQYRKRKNT
jgi:hypothetical protein